MNIILSSLTGPYPSFDLTATIMQSILLYKMSLAICQLYATQISYVIDIVHIKTKNKNRVTIYPFAIQFYILALYIPY